MCWRGFGSKSRGPLIASDYVLHDNLQALNTFVVPLWMRDPQNWRGGFAPAGNAGGRILIG